MNNLFDCPDDPARTEAPLGMTDDEELEFYAQTRENIEELQENIWGVIQGKLPYVRLLNLRCENDLCKAADFAEYLRDALTDEELLMLVAGLVDPFHRLPAKAMIKQKFSSLVQSTAEVGAFEKRWTVMDILDLTEELK